MVEMVIVLAIIGTLAAILTPIVVGYVDQSRVAKAQSDARTIGEAIGRFERDVGRYPMFTSATANTALPDSAANVVTLYSSGTVPSPSSLCTSSPGTPDCAAWNTTPADSDCTATSPACAFDTIENQLLTNNPSYTTNASLAKPFKWKGPYMDLNSSADPWGNAYLVNIIHCKSTDNFACFVLSAGPNGVIDTAHDTARNATVTPQGDDLIYRIK